MRLRDSALTDELLMEIPKAELHIHIEGSLEPEMMFEMAARNGIRLRHGSVRELREAYDFADLQSFLDHYYSSGDHRSTYRPSILNPGAATGSHVLYRL
jgi:adenine deaminase